MARRISVDLPTLAALVKLEHSIPLRYISLSAEHNKHDQTEDEEPYRKPNNKLSVQRCDQFVDVAGMGGVSADKMLLTSVNVMSFGKVQLK